MAWYRYLGLSQGDRKGARAAPRRCGAGNEAFLWPCHACSGRSEALLPPLIRYSVLDHERGGRIVCFLVGSWACGSALTMPYRCHVDASRSGSSVFSSAVPAAAVRSLMSPEPNPLLVSLRY